MSVNPVLQTGDLGVTLPNAIEFFPAGTVLKPTLDRVLIKVLPWNPSRRLKIVSQMRPIRGQVVAVGPGGWQKRYYLNDKGERYKVGETGRKQLMDLKVGDVVDVGGLEIRGYSFMEIMIGHERHIMCQEADVAIVDDDPSELEQTPSERLVGA
jgi:co-chaperonin GroES (HSP10)